MASRTDEHVALWVPAGETRSADTMADLLQNTAGESRVYVFSENGRHAQLDPARFTAVPGQYNEEEAFTEALRRFHPNGFFFVRAGLRLPEAWDLRLVWSSTRHDGVGAVTPLLAPETPPGVDSFSGFDRLCRLESHMEPHACPPSLACVYVTPAAASAVFERWNTPASEPGWAGFLKILNGLRFRTLLADHVAAGPAVPADPAVARTHCEIAGRFRSQGKLQVPAGSSLAPRSLHVLHSWGGGMDHWVRNYCAAGSRGTNLVLRSIMTPDILTFQLWLYRDAGDRYPIRRYKLDPHINGAALQHDSYARTLSNLLDEFAIENIIVSSLIGHSLDVLRTGLPTVMVCHDYFPFCPALNITFHSVCRSCSTQDLEACTQQNPHNRFFRQVPATHWSQLRKAFAATVLERGISMLAPSESVLDHYGELQPQLTPALRVVPHGSPRMQAGVSRPPRTDNSGRLRIVVLGTLSLNKGRELVAEIAAELTQFADLYLIGAGPDGRLLAQRNRITVIDRYEWAELASMLARIDPDLALLPSVVPETFSYTLQELMEFGIPTLATRLGSFNDRIRDGVTGFLCEPSGRALLQRIRELDANRAALTAVREALGAAEHRSVEQMIGDYQKILGSPAYSSKAYFCGDSRAPKGSLTHCRLLWRAPGHPFVETESSSTAYKIPAAREKLTLRLAPTGDAPLLRVDLTDQAATLILHHLKLLDRSGTVIADWNPAELEDAAAGSPHVFAIRNGSEDLVLCAVNGRPSLLLRIPETARAAIRSGATLSVEISVLDMAEAIALIQRERDKLEDPAPLDELLDRMTALQDEDGLISVFDELQHTQRRVQELEASWSWRITKPLRRLAEWTPGLLRRINRQ